MGRSTGLSLVKGAKTCRSVQRYEPASRLSPLAVQDWLEGNPRYAWLEFEGGKWHLVTDLCACPCASDRQWPDSESALDDLAEEGWSVIRPYPEQLSLAENQRKVTGYGLVRHCPVSEAPQLMSDSATVEDRRNLHLYLWASGAMARS